MKLLSVIMVFAGAILVYAAVKNMYPQDVIRKAVGKEPTMGSITKGTVKQIAPIFPPSGLGGGVPPKAT